MLAGAMTRTRLEDLPALLIQRIERGPSPRLHGVFTHLRSVCLGGSWLYDRNSPLSGDLIALDEATREGTFEAPSWDPSSPIQPGTLVPWLHYYSAYHVTMILDPAADWRRTLFTPSDAQHYMENGRSVWTKAPHVPDGAVPMEVVPGGWDHEHCTLCMERIGRMGDAYGYIATGPAYVGRHDWLCDACGEQYAVPRSLAFVWPRGDA
jgi:hypothetical protein